MRRIAFVSCLFFPVAASAATYQVGPTRMYKSPCALLQAVTPAPGDSIVVDAATYTDACQVTASGTAQAPITMSGTAGTRPLFDATGLDLSGAGSVPRAIFQFTGGSHWQVSHLELENASGSSGNGAAFRVTAGSDDITISDVSIHNCQDGIMGDGNGVALIQNSEIYANGANDGQTHNLYMQNDTVRLVGNYIHDSAGGQNVKMRARYVELLYNFIANAGNYEIDLIQGPLTATPNSNAVLIGNVVLRSPTAANDGQTIVFGSDNAAQPGRNGSLYAIHNTFVMTAGTNQLFHAINPAAGAQIVLTNNIVHATVGGTTLGADMATDGLFSGTNDWVTTGIAAPVTLAMVVIGPDPGFVSATDFHLRMGAAAIDKGATTLTFVDGAGAMQDGTPKLENAASKIGTVMRLSDGTPDLGAFEYGTPVQDAGGTSDGSLPPGDAGGSSDAGAQSDAANPVDGGEAGAGATSGSSSGCSCHQAGALSGNALAYALAPALALGIRRRRRHRGRGRGRPRGR